MRKNKLFWITELILLVLSTFFAFALVGYRVLALCLAGLAAVIALYRSLALFGRRHSVAARKLRMALTAFLVLGALAFLALEAQVIINSAPEEDPEADWAIVLGAGVNGTKPSLSLRDRLETALKYAEDYPEAIIIVSGGMGPGEDITEARCMRLWLEEHGVDPARIIEEDRASSTEENLSFSLEIIEEMGGDPKGRTAVITAEYHLCRAKLMAGELGMEPLGVGARTSKPVLRLNYFIREAFAMAAYLML